jgi:hypothetical protein
VIRSKTPADWAEIDPGTTISIVKLAPDGAEATRYPGTVLDYPNAGGWLVARAEWVRRPIETDGLWFMPGDKLHEFFSPNHWFNVFSVFAPDGARRGWYANATFPSWIESSTALATLYWHDLYLDVIALPDGNVVVRDEDELAESGLASSDPELHAQIIRTCDEVVALARARKFPFHET